MGACQKAAFKKVKEIPKNSSLLMHFDINKEIVLACDVSPYDLGTVLSHQTKDGDCSIAFASHPLTMLRRIMVTLKKKLWL